MSETTRQQRTAVILVNLGTPDAPTAPAIRRYLREFLADPRVVNLPRFLWLPILHGFILPLRPRRLVHNYQLIWGRHDGPIRSITAALAARLERALDKRVRPGQVMVRAAMTYGKPSLQSVMQAARNDGAGRFLILPLYPQYAGATTGAVYDVLSRALSHLKVPDFRFVSDYHNHGAYIHALTKSLEPYLPFLDDGGHLLFSFHGIPEAQVTAENPYPQQCAETASLVAHALGLEDDQWQLTYQSRFGPAPWLQPYTSDEMAALPRRGKKRVLVVCPGFATDCLETTEEIKIQNRDIFMANGGEVFRYARALNARDIHVKAMLGIVEEQLFLTERASTDA